MLDRLLALARDNGGLVTTADARAAGVSSQRLTELTRRGALARIRRGIYRVGSAIPGDPREVTRAMRVVLSHHSAAAWWGVELPRPSRRTHVTASRNRGRRQDAVRGVRLHRANLRPDERCVVRGVVVTTPLRTALDIARHSTLSEAVAIVDALMRASLLTETEFQRAAAAVTGPGRRQVQIVAALIDPHAGSVLESLARVLLWRHDLRPPVSQHPFRDATTGFRGLLDFAWPELKVALECDGYEWHREGDPFQRDRRRWSALNRHDWRSAVVTWFDVTGDPDYVVGLVRDLLALRGERAA